LAGSKLSGKIHEKVERNPERVPSGPLGGGEGGTVDLSSNISYGTHSNGEKRRLRGWKLYIRKGLRGKWAEKQVGNSRCSVNGTAVAGGWKQ
jgi:hypothetical protein